MTENVTLFIPVVIVTFRNVQDVLSCLEAVEGLDSPIRPQVFVCENGGIDAFFNLVEQVKTIDGAQSAPPTTPAGGNRFSHVLTIQIPGSLSAQPLSVHLGCAVENLGYAGGVNAWLEPLLKVDGWQGAWILNPDTKPHSAALRELILFANHTGKGMVGSRLTPPLRPDLVHCRGLAWNAVRASTISVDMFMPATVCLPPEEQDKRLDAPSGASIYITRGCLSRIGLMDERYFLYFEDVDWGLRAKKTCGVGYAHQSIVFHTGGTTIGTATSRRDQSPFAVYLDFRNRFLFVRVHYPGWLPWTALVALAHLALYVRAGRTTTMVAAIRGFYAGLMGRSGRPDDMLRAHLAASSKPGHEALR